MGIQITPPSPIAPSAPVASLYKYGVTTSPSANVVLASIATPPAGFYRVRIYVELSGTISASDQDNIRLTVDAVNLTNLLLSAVTPTQNVPTPIEIVVETTGTSIQVKSIAAGTTGAVYGVLVVADRLN